MEQAVAACAPDEDTHRELADRAILDRHPPVAVVNHPVSQISAQSSISSPLPSILWPFRSRVMLSAPITIPLFGQLTRSLSRVVSAVMVAPQLTWLASA